jgi:iron complex transport system ATP-binding protein
VVLNGMAASLQTTALCLGYAGEPPLIEAASFALMPGQALVVLGPNGCGKTTLLRCLLGLARPLAGSVQVQGRDVHALAAAQRARLMAYVPQAAAAAFPFSVFEVVLMGRNVHLHFMADPDAADRAAAHLALERLQIGHLCTRQQRELAQDTPLIVLDEPCASLDLGHQVEVLAALRALTAEGRTVLMASHLPEHALALGAQALLIARGGHHGPAPAAQLLSSASLSALYGTPIEATTLSHGGAAGRRVFVALALADTARAPHTPQENA